MTIDLRSDTFTRPTPGMLEFMMKAPVGDDVFGEDPSVNELEKKAAALFGMEAALYCPTGTMSNQVGIKVHTVPGDEVICDRSSHVYQYEGGGIAFNAGCQVKLLDGNRGRITAAMVEEAINPDDVHKPRTRLVSLENTANRGGGSCYELEELRGIREVCDRHDLRLHLDGARLFNALVATGQSALEYGKIFHSISICLNKGLGCPIGSILIGPAEYIRQSRRIRKVFGGGMRQAGYMAACGIYGLENNINRLAQDHRHAQQIADVLSAKPYIRSILAPETNILIFELTEKYSPDAFCALLAKQNVLALPVSKTQVRMVFHLDIHPEMVERLVEVVGGI